MLGNVGWLVECFCISVLLALGDHIIPLRLEEHDDLEAVPEFSVIASKCDGWVIKDEGVALYVLLPVVAVDGLGGHEGNTTLPLPQPVVGHHRQVAPSFGPVEVAPVHDGGPTSAASIIFVEGVVEVIVGRDIEHVVSVEAEDASYKAKYFWCGLGLVSMLGVPHWFESQGLDSLFLLKFQLLSLRTVTNFLLDNCSGRRLRSSEGTHWMTDQIISVLLVMREAFVH